VLRAAPATDTPGTRPRVQQKTWRATERLQAVAGPSRSCAPRHQWGQLTAGSASTAACKEPWAAAPQGGSLYCPEHFRFLVWWKLTHPSVFDRSAVVNKEDSGRHRDIKLLQVRLTDILDLKSECPQVSLRGGQLIWEKCYQRDSVLHCSSNETLVKKLPLCTELTVFSKKKDERSLVCQPVDTSEVHPLTGLQWIRSPWPRRRGTGAQEPSYKHPSEQEGDTYNCYVCQAFELPIRGHGPSLNRELCSLLSAHLTLYARHPQENRSYGF